MTFLLFRRRPRLHTLTGMDACAVDGRAEPPPPQLHLPMEMDGGGATAAAEQSISAPRSWVIGPLFQSFRSKMATFTEIVMSPVKLFRAPSPPPPTDCPQDGGGEINQLQRCQEETTAAAVKCSKKLSFDDVEETEQADEEPQSGRSLSDATPGDVVPLLVSTSDCVKPSLLVCSVEAEPADPPAVAAPPKPPPTRKCPGTRKKVPSKPVRPQTISRGSESLPSPVICPPDGHRNHLTNADEGPRPPQLGSEEAERLSDGAAAVRRPAADCSSTEPLKKKKKRPVEGVARTARKKAASEGHVTRPAVKTRADRKGAACDARPDAQVKPTAKSQAPRVKASRVLGGAAMALETTIAITELPEPQRIAVVVVRPLNPADNKPCKRKSPTHEGSAWGSGAAPPLEGSRKKQKKAAKSSESGQRSLQSKEVRGQRSRDPLYFEMMLPPPDMPALICSDDKLLLDGAEQLAAGRHASRQRSQEVTVRPRRDSQRGRQRVQRQLDRVGGQGWTAEGDAHSLATPPTARSRLSRSLSCPELPSLAAATVDPAPSIPQRPSRAAASPHPVCHARRSLRRARRHTVCSLEVERELAPLCLRKEVFPSRRSLPCPSPTHSFSTLASCFLSSPLAFLSKRADPTPPSHALAGPAFLPSLCPSSPSTWSLCRADPSGPALDR